MTVTVAELAQTMQTLLTTDAEVCARESGFVKRRRQLTGPVFAQTLVFGWMDNPEATLNDLAVTAAAAGADVTAQAIDRRFGPKAADFLRRLLGCAVAAAWQTQPASPSLLQRFRGVYLLDSTTITLPACLAEIWPGCGGREDTPACAAALKVQLRWELHSATVDGLTLHAGKESETHGPLATASLPKGALRLADLGYFDLDTFRDYARQGVWWLSRLQPKTAVFVAGQRLASLAAWLKQQPKQRLDVAVELGVRQRLACRLIAVRVPDWVARQRRQRLHKKAAKKGRRPQPEQLALCAWNVFVTNLPGELANTAEVLVLARCRWQVELVFKLWKSHGRVDESRSDKPYRVLCEVYGKLLTMVVQHWVLLLWAATAPARSLYQAARAVRSHALHLLSVLRHTAALVEVLQWIVRCLGRRCRVNKRRHKPATFQLIQIGQTTREPEQAKAA
jgi:hypothetical protein